VDDQRTAGRRYASADRDAVSMDHEEWSFRARLMLRTQTTLFGALIALLAIGILTLIVFTVRGGEPPDAVIWFLLAWVVGLSALTLALARRWRVQT
jgi:uncharacterized membrane protein